MQQRILGPLGMKGTGSLVPKEDRNRFATPHSEDSKGEPAVDAPGGGLPADYAAPPSMPTGGSLVSTVGDYLRFA